MLLTLPNRVIGFLCPADMSEAIYTEQQQDWSTSMEEEKPEPAHIKAEKEPEPMPVKDEEVEYGISQEGVQRRCLEEDSSKVPITVMPEKKEEGEKEDEDDTWSMPSRQPLRATIRQ